MTPVSRRRFLAQSGVVAAAVPLGATAPAAAATPARAMKILVIGTTPGDPEAGCGGTMARYADAGHDVVALYLTRGEAGVAGKTHEQAAAVRTAEAGAACRVLKARPVFAGQLDGATEVNAARARSVRETRRGREPGRRLYPMATRHPRRPPRVHIAHLRRLAACTARFALFFYEVDLGSDTQCFSADALCGRDRDRADRKRAACMAHASQKPRRPPWVLRQRPRADAAIPRHGKRFQERRGVHPSRSEPATPVARMTGGLPGYRGFLIISQSTLHASLTRRSGTLPNLKIETRGHDRGTCGGRRSDPG